MRVSNAASLVAPTLATTTVLFNSFTHFAGIPLDVHDIERYVLTVDNNQAGTVNLYYSDDGSTWYLRTSEAIAVPSAPEVADTHDFACDGLKFLKIEWVNGGVTQTTWHPQQELTERQRMAQA